MILADVNVLIEAFRPDGKRHALCHGWLEGEIQGGEPFGLSTLALAAVLRITTQPKFPNGPSDLDEVLMFAAALMGAPGCRLIDPGPHHWPILCQLLSVSGARGSLVTDAWFAALAIEHGCEWVTLDDDFDLFPGLRWRLLG